MKQRVFSGVQPTGNLHLGNYLGAITKFVALQDHYDCVYCVVDMHAITVKQDPADLRRSTREVTAAFIAAGVNPKKHIIFNQSQVYAHAELAWILNCVARIGWLNRMTQFKEKAGKDRENASIGLYVYPVLMAADILAYRATHVPVGDDQKQHLELARDIAQKFNVDFAETIAAEGFADGFFPQPEPIISGPATRVMSLARRHEEDVEVRSVGPVPHQRRGRRRDDCQEDQEGEDRSRAAAERREGLRGPPRGGEPRRDLRGAQRAKHGDRAARIRRLAVLQFKNALADLAVEKLGPIGAEMKRISADTAYIDSVLADGAERARVIADETLHHVRNIVGFVQAARRGKA